jgi:hypothetical protein
VWSIVGDGRVWSSVMVGGGKVWSLEEGGGWETELAWTTEGAGKNSQVE